MICKTDRATSPWCTLDNANADGNNYIRFSLQLHYLYQLVHCNRKKMRISQVQGQEIEVRLAISVVSGLLLSTLTFDLAF